MENDISNALNWKRAIIFSNNGLGNAIMLMPVFRAIEDTFPQLKYFIQSSPAYFEASFAKIAGLRNVWGLFYPQWRRFAKEDIDEIVNFIIASKVDVVFNFRLESPNQDSDFFEFQEIITQMGVDCWSLHDFGISTEQTLIADKIKKMFKLHGIELGAINKNWLQGVYNPVPSKFNETVSFYLGASRSCKRWESHCWVSVLDWFLKTFDIAVRVVSGMSREEQDYANFVYTCLTEGGHGGEVSLVSGRCFSDVLTILSESDMIVTHDTFVSHFVAACRIPAVVLYTATDSDVWQPKSDAPLAIIQSDAALLCPEMKVDGTCRKYYQSCNMTCKNGVTVDEVCEAVSEVFEYVLLEKGIMCRS